MKVVAYFAVSADGFVAGEYDDVSWVSKDSWDNYKKLVSDAKLAVIGRRTYDLMHHDEFISDCRYLVLTTASDISKKHTDIEFSSQPREALAKLKAQGHQCAVAVGGAKSFATLMRDRLINEVYLDVEPVMLGMGVRLFEGEMGTLRLLDSNILANGTTVQLHYQVR